MKRSFWVWCLFIAVNAYGQNRTNVWELSYSTNLLYPNCEMLFFNNVVDTQSVYRTMSFLNTNASICDTNGHILFYTNGLTVGNANYDTLQNADNFNSGYATSDGEPYGLGACQGALFLPYPGQDSLYILFHITGESFFSNGQDEIQPLYLSYSMIDLHLDNGLGAIVDSQKNIQIINDTLTWGRITASKHANGMDWWVIIHRYYSDQYYKLLVTSEGITGPYIQSIGSTVTKDIFGQACFSPDGSRYAMVSQVNVLDYMEFDRCTGEFFNSQTIYVPDSIWTIGCSFSPSGRFLYVSSQTNVFQYDTWSNNMSASAQWVGSWDTFYAGAIPVLLFMQQLAPDNKIYISSFNGTKYLHVINSPDSLGAACSFAPHSFIIPQFSVNIPSFPNYDLGPLPGGDTCNIVYTTEIFSLNRASTYRIAPNPVSDWLNIIYSTDEDALLELFDLYGKRVGAISLFHYFKNRLLNVSELPPGVYLAAVSCKGERVWSEKVVVQR